MRCSEFWTGLSCINVLMAVIMAMAWDPMCMAALLLAGVCHTVAVCIERKEELG